MRQHTQKRNTLGILTLLTASVLAGPASATESKLGPKESLEVEHAMSGGPALAAFGGSSTFELLPASTIGQCLDVEDASMAPAYVSQYTCHGGTNQGWIMQYVGAGQYEIRALHSGLCLDVGDASLNNGALLSQYYCHGGANQRFRINADPSGAFEIRAVHSDKCLDVPWGSTTPGVRIQQYQCHGSTNQRFFFQPR